MAVRCNKDVRRRVSRPRQQTQRRGLQMAAARASVDRVEVQAVGQAAVHAVRILVAHLLVDARPVRILLEALVHQVDVRAFSRRVAQRQARRPLIAPIDPLAIVDILRVAVAREIDECATHPEIVGDRNVERAAKHPIFVVADAGLDVTRKVVHGARRNEIDCAPGRVAAEERALGTAQNFERLDIIELGREDVRKDDWRFVHMDGHA